MSNFDFEEVSRQLFERQELERKIRSVYNHTKLNTILEIFVYPELEGFSISFHKRNDVIFSHYDIETMEKIGYKFVQVDLKRKLVIFEKKESA